MQHWLTATDRTYQKKFNKNSINQSDGYECYARWRGRFTLEARRNSFRHHNHPQPTFWTLVPPWKSPGSLQNWFCTLSHSIFLIRGLCRSPSCSMRLLPLSHSPFSQLKSSLSYFLLLCDSLHPDATTSFPLQRQHCWLRCCRQPTNRTQQIFP